jgi:uncharacterized protein (DUF362 family)
MSSITQTQATADLKADLKRLIQPVIGDIKNLIKSTDRVLLKPNFDTADPYPASTDMDFFVRRD